MKEKYKLEMLFNTLTTRIVHGFDSKVDAIAYVETEGDHVVDYKITVDDLGGKSVKTS